ncbi:MAG: periplasmic polysaccharide biosynthesis/export protein [Desulfuromonadales bacterium GWD2_61_12]|nr:MAG: periplasmic polysaccharide biosynthesis/export protein [Desulfuromonadales bacterium GWC2_61_20]OGR36533.1 MAG: periplasmic polysaccharide biosynthesis/export protein [Desulfuromonadales bacterium GWD2_61_12]HAD05075.1 periplasmic polysaccharide biosynthesis/export protein [Desulfuromonas sp.]HBT83976.1 periplasmic polysaccharide biosynthesis/export protein [Desulfuromonas sp.]
MNGKLVGNIALFLFFLGVMPLCAAEPGNYLIGAGDVLKIAVYDHPDLSTTVRVNNDGSINFPLIGTVHVAGGSVAKASTMLGAALADGYIVNPQVSVFIEEFRSRKAIIMGQVKNPGLYELSGPSTLLELISKAGGLSANAGESVSIKRRASAKSGEEQLLTLNLKDLTENGDASLNVSVLDGDSVFVAETGTLYVTGQVNRPNAYRIGQKTSIIKAVTMAGGFTELAAKGRVKIIRKVNGTDQVLENVPLHTAVLPEDVIVVPESFF